MKNLSLILNLVLLVAVAVLFFLHFSGNDTAQASPASTSVQSMQDLRIAYVNTDSVLSNYDYMEEVTADLEKTKTKLEGEYKNRLEGLQREFDNFQKSANNMTRAQATAVQEDLMQKRQNLAQYQQNLSQQMMQAEAEKQNELYDKVVGYLKEYGEGQNLQMVLTYTKGSGVLFASDSLDITNAIIEGLNDQYRSGDESTAEETDSTATGE